MFVKVYDKVINYIKKEYKFLIVIALILFLGLYRLPYNLYMGGGLIDVADRISIEGEYKEKGSFNMTYVKTSPATIPTYLLSYVFSWERESVEDIKLDENDTKSNMWQRDLLYLKEANDSAIINAYQKANADIKITKEVLYVLYVDKDSETDLLVGDTIISVNDKLVNSYEELKKMIDEFNVGDKVKVLVKRNDKEEEAYFVIREMDNVKRAGIYLVKSYEYELKPKIELDFSDNEGGPSGGFMLSLAIYNRLIEEDLTKGRKIAGTGTIDKDGNIGEIGGVRYKVIGASKGDADVFFVPEANYEEAIAVAKENNYDLNIVKVKTFDDAIDYLRS